MRIALRANASLALGTGHVTRQISLAQNLLAAGNSVTLFASIPSPGWLRDYVRSQQMLGWVEVDEGDFTDETFSTGCFDALVLDAYNLGQHDLERLEQKVPVVAVIIDGPWQDLRGRLAIAPSLEDNASWFGDYRDRFASFESGPEFFMLREELVTAKLKRHAGRVHTRPRVVLALGGSDDGVLTTEVLQIIDSASPWVEIDAYIPLKREELSLPIRPSGRVRVHQPGPGFIDDLASADLAVVGAGTTVAEVNFLGVPAIFIVVAENQQENAESIIKQNLGLVFCTDDPSFPAALSAGIAAVAGNLAPGKNVSDSRPPLVDGLGAQRVRAILEKAVGTHVDA